jgi:hypothetical protein
MAQTRGSTMTGSPVDNETYNLLQTLTSKLEAIDIYRRYEQDSSGQSQQLFRELADQDSRAAERLVEAVRQKLTSH